MIIVIVTNTSLDTLFNHLQNLYSYRFYAQRRDCTHNEAMLARRKGKSGAALF